MRPSLALQEKSHTRPDTAALTKHDVMFPTHLPSSPADIPVHLQQNWADSHASQTAGACAKQLASSPAAKPTAQVGVTTEQLS